MARQACCFASALNLHPPPFLQHRTHFGRGNTSCPQCGRRCQAGNLDWWKATGCSQAGADEGVGAAVEGVEGEGEDIVVKEHGGVADKVDRERHVVDCDTKEDWKQDNFQLVSHRIDLVLAVAAKNF